MTERLERMMRKLGGDGAIEQHILLLKLTNLLENAPDFGESPAMDPATPQRQWLSEAGALLSRLGMDKKVQFRASFQTAAPYWVHAVTQIKGQVLDAIEELKLELELEGRSEIGSAYAPGEVYQFFADLKTVVHQAQQVILVVDPYFNGEAFDAYLSTVGAGLKIWILADRYSKDIEPYVAKHMEEFGSTIELRSSKEIHDRVVFIDDDQAWIMGGSIKDAGKKATYLIPIAPGLSVAKKAIYMDIWDRAECV